jgi:hypothetical protein
VEVCHWLINIVKHWVSGGGKKVNSATEFLQRISKDIDYNLEAKVCELFGRTERPMQGWDSNQAVFLLKNYELWASPLIERHPLGSVVRQLLEVLKDFVRLLMKPELSDVDIKELEVATATFGKGCSFFFSPSGVPPWLRHRCGRVNEGSPQARLFAHTHNFSWYDHDLVCHGVAAAREHRSFIRFSSWVVEACNKLWKRVLVDYTSHGGGNASGSGVGVDEIGRQTLQRMCRMFNPQSRLESAKGVRLAGAYHCGKCLSELVPGHSKFCAFQQKGMMAEESDSGA